MDTAIDLPFADGVYTFDLALPQIREIQDKCGGDGIGAIYARVMKGRYLIGETAVGNPLEADYRIDDVIEPIRQGLIGGGKGVVDDEEVTVTAFRAGQLVQRYLLDRGNPIEAAWSLAAAILGARIIGFDPPEKEAAREPSKKKAAKSERAGSITPEPSSTAP